MLSPGNPLIQHSYNKFPSAVLAVADFDGTVTDPYVEHEGILSVHEIAIASIDRILGRDARDRWYARPDDCQVSLDSSLAATLTYLVPDATPQNHAEMTKRIVDTQVEQLISQIGQRLPDGSLWPKLVPGFVECWEAITKAKAHDEHEDDKRVVSTAFLSRGYERYINAVLAHYDIVAPDHLIAHEQTDSTRYHGILGDEVGKGYGLQLNTLAQRWMLSFGITVIDEFKPRPDQITLIGDSASDIREAESLKANMIFIDPEHPERAWKEMAQFVKLGKLSIAESTEG
jgi:hypothetical protein